MALRRLLGLGVVAILVLFGAVSWIQRPPARPIAPVQPPPEIKAEISLTAGKFHVRNLGELPWREVILVVNPSAGKYEYRTAYVGPRESVLIDAMEFASREGVRFNPYQLKALEFGVVARVNGVATMQGFAFSESGPPRDQ